MKDDFDVTVICTVPSYSGVIQPSYRTKFLYKENINGVSVFRIRVPEFSKDNRISRIKNILAYFLGAIIVTFSMGPQNYVFSVSQPPILGGMLGVMGKWIKRAKYIYNIQDFNPEQIKAVGYSKNHTLLKILMALDKFSCCQSDLVVTVGDDLIETMRARFMGRTMPDTIKIHNWINEKEVYPLSAVNKKVAEFKKCYGLENKYVVMYSGNIGLYYDLENILKALMPFKKGYTKSGMWCDGAKAADGREVVFAFVGGGSLLCALKNYAEEHDFQNVVFIPYQEKKQLIYSLNAADLHWCISSRGIKGVSVPSKVYGIMAVGKPIIGVMEKGTEARNIIEQAKCGICCDAGDYRMIQEKIRWFVSNANSREVSEMGQRGRKYLNAYLTKEDAVKKYKKAFDSLREN